MEKIELVEVQKKYAPDIWEFRQEILECDADVSGKLLSIVLGN